MSVFESFFSFFLREHVCVCVCVYRFQKLVGTKHKELYFMLITDIFRVEARASSFHIFIHIMITLE